MKILGIEPFEDMQRSREMNDPFDPRTFEAVRTTIDPDADLMLAAVRLPVQSRPAKAQQPYIPAIPKSFLRAIAVAGDSVELLLVALAEMRKRGTSEISLGPALWQQVGNPSKRVRSRLLNQILRLPPHLCVLSARQGRPHLLVTGPDWPHSLKLIRV
jgi:hypothetical protein